MNFSNVLFTLITVVVFGAVLARDAAAIGGRLTRPGTIVTGMDINLNPGRLFNPDGTSELLPSTFRNPVVADEMLIAELPFHREIARIDDETGSVSYSFPVPTNYPGYTQIDGLAADPSANYVVVAVNAIVPPLDNVWLGYYLIDPGSGFTITPLFEKTYPPQSVTTAGIKPFKVDSQGCLVGLHPEYNGVGGWYGGIQRWGVGIPSCPLDPDDPPVVLESTDSTSWAGTVATTPTSKILWLRGWDVIELDINSSTPPQNVASIAAPVSACVLQAVTWARPNNYLVEYGSCATNAYGWLEISLSPPNFETRILSPTVTTPFTSFFAGDRPSCGDGTVFFDENGGSLNEQCDNGAENGPNGCCSATCQIQNVGASCDDGNACTDGDACSGFGVCDGSSIDCSLCTDSTACDPQTGCAGFAVPDGTSCVDGDACTSSETCQNGLCKGPRTEFCDDGNPCTANPVCNSQTGCSSVPVAPSSSSVGFGTNSIVVSKGSEDAVRSVGRQGEAVQVADLLKALNGGRLEVCLWQGVPGEVDELRKFASFTLPQGTYGKPANPKNRISPIGKPGKETGVRYRDGAGTVLDLFGGDAGKPHATFAAKGSGVISSPMPCEPNKLLCVQPHVLAELKVVGSNGKESAVMSVMTDQVITNDFDPNRPTNRARMK